MVLHKMSKTREASLVLCSLIIGCISQTVVKRDVSNKICRMETLDLSPENFTKATCAMCYISIPRILKNTSIIITYLNDTYELFDGNETFTADPNISSPIDQSLSLEYRRKWAQCCLLASSCCDKMLNDSSNLPTGSFCPVTWDGRQCWDLTNSEGNTTEECSIMATFFYSPKCKRYVTRTCSENGEWKEANYTSCRGQQSPDDLFTPTEGTCRIDTGEYLTPLEYRKATCARCYHFLHREVKKENFALEYESDTHELCDKNTNTLYVADPDNMPDIILDSLTSKYFMDKLVACCKSSIPCCDKMLNDPVIYTDGVYCNRTWDGWQCWPDTLANEIAKAECSANAYTFSKPACIHYATKKCRNDGKWFKNPRTKNEWTNYSTCADRKRHKTKLDIHIGTLSVSAAFLIPAIAIFGYFKQLQSYRTKMHLNFFISLLFYAFFFILLESYIVYDEIKGEDKITVADENKAGCKIIAIMSRYFRTCNYMWMFCEGFFLHKQIAAAFSQQSSFLMFYIIGWGLPAIPVSIYAIIRKTMYDKKCWIGVFGEYEWIYTTPLLLSLVINVGFLINVIRILVSKVRASHSVKDDQLWRVARAILVLIPLFGVHLVLFLYRPQNHNCLALDIYTSASNAVDGIQGAVVACLFCYLNREVWTVIKKAYYRYRIRREGPVSSVTRPSRPSVSTVDSSLGNGSGS